MNKVAWFILTYLAAFIGGAACLAIINPLPDYPNLVIKVWAAAVNFAFGLLAFFWICGKLGELLKNIENISINTQKQLELFQAQFNKKVEHKREAISENENAIKKC